MKTQNFLSLLVLCLLVAQAPEKLLAQNLPAQMTFHVTDDSSNPISGLGFALGSWVSPAWNVSATVTNSFGSTDSNGNLTLSFLSENGMMGFGTKFGTTGYYGTHDDYQFKKSSDGKWQPWNPTVNVIVKPILNPIPMYALAVGRAPLMDLPSKNLSVGFDLEAGDFVAPYGKGTVSDFILNLTEKVPFVSYSQPFDISLNLSFSNKGDGIQSFLAPLNHGSALRLPRHAPEGGYQPTLVQETSRSSDGKVLNNQFNQEQNYFFRVRTVLDESGNVKSALYGKISGPLSYDFINSKNKTALMFFTYYLNPNPNDRNMEFDPSKNLFQNLTDDQQVKAP